MKPLKTRVDIPIGRVVLMGQGLHIVEHGGRLAAVCNDEHGVPFEALASERLDRNGCRKLMRDAVEALVEAVEISLISTACTRDPGRRTVDRVSGLGRNHVTKPGMFVKGGARLRISPATTESRPES